MRAVQAREFGGPEVLVATEVADPVAGPGQVLIAVAAVDTLFIETQVRAGLAREFFPLTPPYVPGGGVAGTVQAVGDGVDSAWLGRRVAGMIGYTGGYAELAAAPVSSLVPVPSGVALTDAAALIHDAVTATVLMRNTAVADGEQVLITGASGGMGTLLVQLAVAAGARVVGVARGPEKTSLVSDLKADAVIDAGQDGWVSRARAALGERGADVVLDGVGGELGRAAFDLVADGGRFSAHGWPAGGFAAVDASVAARRGVRLLGIADVQLAPAEHASLGAQVLDDAAAGRLRPVIGATFSLADAAAAHAAIEARSLTGKVVLTTSPAR